MENVIDDSYDALRYIAQIDQDGYFRSLRSNLLEGNLRDMVITMEDFLSRTTFAEDMRDILNKT